MIILVACLLVLAQFCNATSNWWIGFEQYSVQVINFELSRKVFSIFVIEYSV